MLKKICLVILGLVVVLFGLQGLGWVMDPATAAQGLGMPLLDEMGRSSQVGDFSAFFIFLSVAAIIGFVTRNRAWFLASALLLGLAAVGRTLAWALHDAPFATTFIVIEIVFAGIIAWASGPACADID